MSSVLPCFNQSHSVRVGKEYLMGILLSNPDLPQKDVENGKAPSNQTRLHRVPPSIGRNCADLKASDCLPACSHQPAAPLRTE